MSMPQQEQPLELLDIYDVYYEPWWLNVWLWYGMYVAGAVLVCVGVYLLIRRLIPKKQIPYWQKSINAITALRTDFDDPKVFYVHLTDIIKRYLDERYALPLVGKTDTELLQSLEHDNAVPKAVYQGLKEILEGVVYIKFAHSSAALEQMKKAQRTALIIIQETHHLEKK